MSMMVAEAHSALLRMKSVVNRIKTEEGSGKPDEVNISSRIVFNSIRRSNIRWFGVEEGAICRRTSMKIHQLTEPS